MTKEKERLWPKQAESLRCHGGDRGKIQSGQTATAMGVRIVRVKKLKTAKGAKSVVRQRKARHACRKRQAEASQAE